MTDTYPLAITVPSVNPKDNGRPNQVVVQNPKEHKQRFPQHYEDFTTKLTMQQSTSSKVLDQAEALERERCAQIALTHNHKKIGSEIAEMIRKSGPAPVENWGTDEAQPDTPPVEEGLVLQPGAPLPGTAGAEIKGVVGSTLK